MKLLVARTGDGLVASSGDEHRRLADQADLDSLLTTEHPFRLLAEWFDTGTPCGRPLDLLAPIQSQEVWGAGVTYSRSRAARMDESRDIGAEQFYSMVYEAERPELFFKATPNRVVGHHGAVRIREDSVWNVPEPELTLVVTSKGEIIGHTIGNDMSSRSIEGENPLYLPQAKVYAGCAALGPWLVVTESGPDDGVRIAMTIARSGSTVFEGATRLDQMRRTFRELTDYLFRDNEFPAGVFLMTGTGIVPDDDFTLAPGDEVAITIDGVGTLVNHVQRGV